MTPTPKDDKQALRLTDFTPIELEIADALGVRNKLPVDKNLFDGGCLCHTYPKDSDDACGNHAKMLGNIKNMLALIDAYTEQRLVNELESLIKGQPVTNFTKHIQARANQLKASTREGDKE